MTDLAPYLGIVTASVSAERLLRAIQPWVAPWLSAKAEIWKEQKLASTSTNITQLRSELLTNLHARAELRSLFELVSQQENIEAISRLAVENVSNVVSNEEVKKDWLSAFFDSCKDVSEADVQLIWARILAGEVAHPGRYSRRTLGLLRDLDSQEAGLIRKFATVACFFENSNLAFVPAIAISGDSFEPLRQSGLAYYDLVCAAEANLIASTKIYVLQFTEPDPIILCGTKRNMRLSVSPQPLRVVSTEQPMILNVYQFTRAGSELLSLTSEGTNELYMKATSAHAENVKLSLTFSQVDGP